MTPQRPPGFTRPGPSGARTGNRSPRRQASAYVRSQLSLGRTVFEIPAKSPILVLDLDLSHPHFPHSLSAVRAFLAVPNPLFRSVLLTQSKGGGLHAWIALHCASPTAKRLLTLLLHSDPQWEIWAKACGRRLVTETPREATRVRRWIRRLGLSATGAQTDWRVSK